MQIEASEEIYPLAQLSMDFILSEDVLVYLFNIRAHGASYDIWFQLSHHLSVACSIWEVLGLLDGQ